MKKTTSFEDNHEKLDASNYTIVGPADYTAEHKKHITSVKKNLLEVSRDFSIYDAEITDVHSTGIVATDNVAELFGLERGEDFAGLNYANCPLPEIVERAELLFDIDKQFIQLKEAEQTLSVLHVYNYATGLKARMSRKTLFCHHPSRAILGIISSSYNVKYPDIFSMLPEYMVKFGNVGKKLAGRRTFAESEEFTDQEKIACFLFLRDWSAPEIADFINKHGIGENFDQDHVYRLKNNACYKLGIYPPNLENLVEYLVHLDFHQTIPDILLKVMIGSQIISIT